MSDRFIKMIDSTKTDELQEYFPNAFLLLCYIARRARRTLDDTYGLEPGDAIVGELESSKKSGLSKKAYRNALEKLEELGFVKTVFNPKNKKPQKRAIKRAIKSKVVQLCDDSIFDINREVKGDQKGKLRANKGRSEGDKQERQERTKNVKKQQQLPADEIYSCLKIPELGFSDQVSLMQTGMTERRIREGVAFAHKKKSAGQIKTSFGACVGWYVRQDKFFPDLSEQMIMGEKYLRELEAMRMETAVQLNENFRETETLYVLLKGKETRISLKDPPGLVESQINECLREVKEKFKHKIVSLESENDLNDLGNEKDIGELP